MKLLAITSCPNGIAHTYMAAENLEKAAKNLNVSMKVETQGGVGVENELTAKEIKEADGIIVAADNKVDMTRFVGKKVIITNVQSGIHKGEELIKRFQDDEVKVYEGVADFTDSDDISFGGELYKHLMAGVSRMIPFIVVGGIFIALALGIGTPMEYQGGGVYGWGTRNAFWQGIYFLGSSGFTFMVPALAGFIAYSIADKPGITPGFAGGWFAVNGQTFFGAEAASDGSFANAGFLGGIVAGFLAGYTVRLIKKVKVHEYIKPIMPIIIIPLVATFIVGFLMMAVVGAPMAWLFTALETGLANLHDGGIGTIAIATILGAMIAIDMGGPINKVAFMFSAAMIMEGQPQFMGMTAVAIATPPIGMGIASLIAKNKYTSVERDAGKAAIAMGFFGITEGAIPFAAADPARVIPANVIGAVVGAIIAGLLTIQNMGPHGGPIMAFFAIDGGIWYGLLYILAIIIGSVVTALIANILKKPLPTT